MCPVCARCVPGVCPASTDELVCFLAVVCATRFVMHRAVTHSARHNVDVQKGGARITRARACPDPRSAPSPDDEGKLIENAQLLLTTLMDANPNGKEQHRNALLCLHNHLAEALTDATVLSLQCIKKLVKAYHTELGSAVNNRTTLDSLLRSMRSFVKKRLVDELDETEWRRLLDALGCNPKTANRTPLRHWKKRILAEIYADAQEEMKPIGGVHVVRRKCIEVSSRWKVRDAQRAAAEAATRAKQKAEVQAEAEAAAKVAQEAAVEARTKAMQAEAKVAKKAEARAVPAAAKSEYVHLANENSDVDDVDDVDDVSDAQAQEESLFQRFRRV